MRRILYFVLITVFVVGSILPLFGASQRSITLSIGSAKCTVDGQEQWMDVAPFVQDGRTFVPIRFVSEALGATVDYTKYADGSVKDVIITLDESIFQTQPQVEPTALEIAGGTPIAILQAWIVRDVIGTPEVHVQVENVSDKTIDGFKIQMKCYDRFGDPVGHYSAGSNLFTGVFQSILYSGLPTQTPIWTLYGFDLTAKVYLNLVLVHYQDGTTWEGTGPTIQGEL